MGSKRNRNGTSAARRERDARNRRTAARANRRRWWLIGTGGVVAILVTVVVTVLALQHDSSTAAPFAGSTIEVPLSDYRIGGTLVAPAGRVRLHVTNVGGALHNIGVQAHGTSPNLSPGGSAMLDLGVLAPGSYPMFCDVDNHRAMGMTAMLVITETAPVATVAG